MTDNSLISIDFDALDHNMRVVRDAVGPGVAPTFRYSPSRIW